MTQPFFPCTISAQSRNNEFLTIKTVVRKTHQKNGHTGSSCLDKAVLAQRGGGGTVAVTRGVVVRKETQVCSSSGDSPIPSSKGQEGVKMGGRAATNVRKI